MSKRKKRFKPSRPRPLILSNPSNPSNPSKQSTVSELSVQIRSKLELLAQIENKSERLEKSQLLEQIGKQSEELHLIIRDSNFLEHLIIKISNFLEHIAPHNWQKSSFYFHDIVEDHWENLLPTYRKRGCEWIANFITGWRLLFFLWHFGLSLLRTAITTRRSNL